MVENRLLEHLNRLGFPQMEATESFDVNRTLAEVVQGKDARLWEGFPVLLANAGQESSFDYHQVLDELTDKEDQNDLHSLLLVALAVYQFHHLSFLWADRLRKKLSALDGSQVKTIKKSLAQDERFAVGTHQFDSSRLKNLFQNYFQQNAEKTRQLKEKHEEMSLEYALSQLFSAKQKELFKKRLEGLPLTKTEREYYSRTVKKKVSALANPELHRLAQKLLSY
ncbi:hypothetical protein ACFL6N_04515 [Thermodesulfobacteriota bacterium]